MGVGEDLNLENSISVTVIATGFDPNQQDEIIHSDPKKIIHNLDDNSGYVQDLSSDLNKDKRDSLQFDFASNSIDFKNTNSKIESLENSQLINDNDVDYKNSDLDQMHEIGIHTSEKEVSAIKAEQTIEDMKKAEYMRQFIGEEFEGHIASVLDYGFFVELDNTVRGLIKFARIQEFIKVDNYKIKFSNKELDIFVLKYSLFESNGLSTFIDTSELLLTKGELITS